MCTIKSDHVCDDLIFDHNDPSPEGYNYDDDANMTEPKVVDIDFHKATLEATEIFDEDLFMENTGLFYLDDNNRKIRATHTPFKVNAAVTDADTGNHSTLLTVTDRDGIDRQELLMANEMVLGGGPAIRKLADAGMIFNSKGEKQVLRAIRLSNPKTRLELTPRSGWHKDSNCFVMPQEIIGKPDGKEILFQPKNESLAKGFFSQGSLDGWKEHVASLAQGNPIAITVLCASLSGPLQKLCSFSGGGIHIYGRSSRGKTTTTQLGASVWGNGTDPSVPDDRLLIRTWNSTGNAMDPIAEMHSDTFLPLDEIGQFGGKDFGTTIYNLAGGLEKTAMNRDRTMKNTGRWCSNIFSTGEKSVQQMINESTGQAKAGQLVRLPSVPVTDIFVETHGMPAAAFVNHLKKACGQYFGTAGPAFVRELHEMIMENTAEDVSRYLRNSIEDITAALAPESVLPEQLRVIRRFALYQVAGELAVEAEILPFTKKEIGEAIRHLCDLWLAGTEELSDAGRAIDKLRSFILKNHSAFVSINNRNAKVSSAKGFYNPSANLYLFEDDQLKEACGGHDPKDIVRELRDQDLLVTHEGGRLKVKQKLAWLDKWYRFYAVKGSIIADDETTINDDDPHEIEC